MTNPHERASVVEHYLELQQQPATAVDRFVGAHEEAVASGGAELTGRYSALMPATPPGEGQQYAFEVDLDACSGCKSCVAACHAMNGLEDEESWRDVGLLHGGGDSQPVLQHVTTACHHCLDPACMHACPVDAYEKDPATGIVKHLDDQCFGCQYCTLACPYDAPKYSPAKGVVRKCDMCSDRLAEGEAPACVQSCAGEAIRIRIVDADQVVEESETNLFVPGAPEPAITLPTTTYRTARVLPRNMIPADYYAVHPTAPHWPLIVMLALTQMSVGAFLVEQVLGLVAPSALMASIRPLHSASALVFGLLALVVSVLHLGRPQYAFRAVMWERVLRNPRHPAVVVLDPRFTETAMQATQHLPLRPKSDQALLYGIARIVIERGWIDARYVEAHTRGYPAYAAFVQQFTLDRVAADTGLEPAAVERLAATIHAGERVSFWWTMGVNQSYQGVRTAQAIIDLALLTGNIGRPGTGANSITGQCNAMGSRLFSNTTNLLGGHDFADAGDRAKVAGVLGIDPAAIPGEPSWAYHEIVKGILEERIKGLWVIATNTAHSWINQAQAHDILGRLDFLVVQDMYASTETARMADLVLPPAGWGEKDGTVREIRTFGALIGEHGRGHGCEVCKPAVGSMFASLWNENILDDAHQTLQDTNDRFLANMQRGGRLLGDPAGAGGRDHPRQADRARRHREEVRPLHQVHRGGSASTCSGRSSTSCRTSGRSWRRRGSRAATPTARPCAR